MSGFRQNSVSLSKIRSYLWGSILLIILNSDSSAVEFKGNLQMRYDNGEEVDPGIAQYSYPGNQVDRKYFESLLTLEAIFPEPSWGDRLRVGIRILEFQPSAVDGTVYGLNDETRIDDKIYAQLKWNRWEFWAGDVYETFGRGLTLSVFENRDLYFDTGLRGGKISYLSKKFRLKGIYGTSREGYLVEEENIGGLNLEYYFSRGLFIGGSIVHQEGINLNKQYMPELYGGINYGIFSFYGNYAQARPDEGDFSVGEGTYLSLETAVMGWAAQFGYKYYSFGSDNPFRTPPVVQREITTHLLSAHPHVPLLDDQVGFEFDLSGSPSDRFFLNVNFSRASKHKGGDMLPSLKQKYSGFWELFTEGEWYARDDLTFIFGAGANEEGNVSSIVSKTGLAWKTIYRLSDYWSVTTEVENMWVDEQEMSLEYNEQFISFSLSRANWGSAGLTFEQSSFESPEEGDNWAGFELTLDLVRDHRLQLFYGRERGGLKCTSGVCRQVQPFEGFRLTYEGIF